MVRFPSNIQCPFLEVHSLTEKCPHVLTSHLPLARENTSNLKLLLVLCMCKSKMVIDCCFCWKSEGALNVCAEREVANIYFVKGQCWYKFLLRSLVILQVGISIPAWHQMCGKKPQRLLDNKV